LLTCERSNGWNLRHPHDSAEIEQIETVPI
jgi:hypothetical protein